MLATYSLLSECGGFAQSLKLHQRQVHIYRQMFALLSYSVCTWQLCCLFLSSLFVMAGLADLIALTMLLSKERGIQSILSN